MGVGVLYLVGIELNTVSLAALIVVLGMVVDNSIVVIDNHVEKLDHGETPWKAAWKSATQLFIPVLTATMAINMAFFPMMFFLTGIAGDFIGIFPLTIFVVLTISMLVAVLIVPVLNYFLIRKGVGGKAENANSFLNILQRNFDRLLEWAFAHSKITLVFTVAILIGSLLLFTSIPQQLFPMLDRDQIAVEIYLPDGSSVHQTDKVIDSLESVLSADARVRHVTSFIGTGSPRFHTAYAPHLPATNYGQLIVNTISEDASIEILDEYSRKYTNAFAGAHIKFKQLELAKTASPIEVRLSADSIKNLKEAAAMVTEIMNQEEGLIWIRTDWGTPRPGIQIQGLPEQTGRLGLTRMILGSSLLASTDGIPLATIWEGDYPVNVVLLNNTDKQISNLGNQYITPPLTMQAVPLRSVAKLVPDYTEGTIVRRNGVRTITVSADSDRDAVATDIFNRIQPQIEALNLPEGVQISYGGELEATQETFVPMIYSLITSVFIIFFILLFQFRKVNKTAIIMLSMLLAFPGAAAGLWIVDYPFSMTAFIGIMGLVGIVVRNGIILVDYIEELTEDGSMNMYDAALAAGKRRMRPIFLTSAAAAVGVVPMILSGSPLWGPLGTVICFGLLVAMVLTLIILPLVYALVFRNAKPVQIPQ
jgi:multidrug efflux pump subunit AcrB